MARELRAAAEAMQQVQGEALRRACHHGYATEAERLLDEGASVNAASPYGVTALRLACLYNREECAGLLLSSGADVNLPNDDGLTALMYACANGHEAIARLLCAYGAKRDAADIDGATALTYARIKGHHPLANWLEATHLWTPLHHLEQLTSQRAAALLRDGGDPHARAAGVAAAPSPFELAKAMQAAEGGVAAGSAAALVILEVEGWAAENRQLMAAEACERAEVLSGMLAWLAPRFSVKGDEGRLRDPWKTEVLPRVLRCEYIGVP